MLVVSNYLFDKTDLVFPDDVVARVNVAWLKDIKELHKVLKRLPNDIYLDYPEGRTKPPVPKISFKDAILSTHLFPRIKYFAISNSEEPEHLLLIKRQLPPNIQIVPKIETKRGVANIEAIYRKIANQYIMLDKEDLYIDVGRDSKVYETLVGISRFKSKELGIDILELHGVIFRPYLDKIK